MVVMIHICYKSNLYIDTSVIMIYPNPRHLRAFVAVAASGGFGAAARAVHIGQPALSQAIANLEALVGVKLIERTTRAVRLTPAGAEFLIDAKRVLEENDRLMRHGAEWAQALRGSLTLLSIISVAHRLLPGIVRAFKNHHPDVRVEVHDVSDVIMRERMARGEGDLAIITETNTDTGKVLLPFLQDHFRFICPAAHPLAAQSHIEGRQLKGEQLILLRHGAVLRTYADTALSRLKLIHPLIEVDQLSTLVGMVEGGLGVSLIPALSCPPLALRSVVSRPFARPDVFRRVAFARPRDRAPMPAVGAFVRLTMQLIADGTVAPPEGVEGLAASANALKLFSGDRR